MLLLIDKPSGMTSHDVVNIVRKKTNEKRVGHGGTLDPMASGLLVVGVGREFTKQLGDITKNTNKVYEAEVTLGFTSDTDDAEGEITRFSAKVPSSEEVEKTINEFVGVQLQTPPAYSAIKLKGKKAYELARRGISPQLKPRQITVHSIKGVDYVYPKINLVCDVSSGTYIRSLARDIGEKLQTGAYLSGLRRTAVGEFDVKNAVKLEQV